jgi:hypothetical protein
MDIVTYHGMDIMEWRSSGQSSLQPLCRLALELQGVMVPAAQRSQCWPGPWARPDGGMAPNKVSSQPGQPEGNFIHQVWLADLSCKRESMNPTESLDSELLVCLVLKRIVHLAPFQSSSGLMRGMAMACPWA